MKTAYDVLIIGSGAAGLSLALRIADHFKVAVVSKGPLREGSTLYAQGGISAVLDQNDSLSAHVTDTLTAGAGLCDEDAVRFTVENGPEAVQWLIDLGVPFTKLDRPESDRPTPDQAYHLTREGGHSHRRVIHADDSTGLAVETTLENATRAHPNIDLFEQHMAIDLITHETGKKNHKRCLGAYIFDRKERAVTPIKARSTVLATGGASKVYLYTSNPDSSTGDGIAMAWRAGCRVTNMEFMQFHPTCLYHPSGQTLAARSFLISEAVRGEGGILRLPDGTAFMDRFDHRAELAPRDVVARAIDHEMKRLGLDCVYLDISHKEPVFIQKHFPTIYQRCLDLGYDMTKEPLPVVPAAHYTCGGIMTDLEGRTDLPGLYAIGETAFTGLHGANRMASNSLLECLVFAASVAKDLLATLDQTLEIPDLKPWDESRVTDSDEEIVVSHNWAELRRSMWNYVGIVRTDKRLERARSRVNLLLNEIDEYYGNFRITDNLLELRNLAQVASLIVESALRRKESRGLHYTLDYPDMDDQTNNNVLPGKP